MGILYCNGERFRKAFIAGANWLTENKEILNQLNVFPVPDGDTGVNMSLTLLSATDELKNMSGAPLNEILKIIAQGTLMGARGCSGVIFSQVMAGFAELTDINDRLTSNQIAQGLKLGSDKAYKSVTRPVEGTILTVIREASDEAIKFARENDDIVELIEVVLQRAKISLDNTPNLLPVLAQAGVIDSGGQGFVYMLEGMLGYIQGNMPKFLHKSNFVSDSLPAQARISHNIEYDYCTEFLLADCQESIPFIREKMAHFGDDLVVISWNDLIRIHIHTNDPEKVLEIAHSYGNPTKVKIDDMQKQHRHIVKIPSDASYIDQEISVVATAPGGGQKAVMVSLGADNIIVCDETRNPSVLELLDALNEAICDKVILLPNDRNIISAAKQAARMTDKEVKIVSSKNISQGFSALLAFRADLDIDSNLENMTEAMEYVKHGEVNRAVRKAQYGDLEIKEDDIVGLFDGSIRIAAKSYTEAILQLVELMIQEKEDEIITIYYGEIVDADEAEEIVNALVSAFPDQDVELHYGGQFYCTYIVSVE